MISQSKITPLNSSHTNYQRNKLLEMNILLDKLSKKLLKNISKEQKLIFLLEDFNVNLLNYNEHNQTN